jgi:hypothetical protein
MRWVVFAVLDAVLMVNGQESKPHGNTHKRNSATESKDAPNTAGQTVVIVNQQTPQRQNYGHTSQSPSYFHELLLPQNIPTDALVIVGIAGIVIAICTLKKIGKQVDEMGRATGVMQRQVDAQNESLRARITVGFSQNVFDMVLQDGIFCVFLETLNGP